MKRLIITIIGIAFLFSNEEKGNIEFQYGFLGWLQSNPDSTIELIDSSIVHTDDQIRINVGYISSSYFYLIYLDSEGVYYLTPGVPTEEDTTYITLLRGGLVKPPGRETFYLINSRKPLTELTELIGRLEKAPGKGKVKIANRIRDQIDALDPNIKEDLAFIPNRLDKPMVGGVAFRGEDDDALKDMSLTHICTGSDGVAFQKIVLNHQ